MDDIRISLLNGGYFDVNAVVLKAESTIAPLDGSDAPAGMGTVPHIKIHWADAILASASVSAGFELKSKPIPKNMAAESASRGG